MRYPDGTAGERCGLRLEGKGSVTVSGVVVDDETNPSGRSAWIEWTPMPGHGAVVRRRAEFPLTTAGEGPRTERLEDYPWTVELD
jgi:hypothetical protein